MMPRPRVLGVVVAGGLVAGGLGLAGWLAWGFSRPSPYAAVYRQLRVGTTEADAVRLAEGRPRSSLRGSGRRISLDWEGHVDGDVRQVHHEEPDRLSNHPALLTSRWLGGNGKLRVEGEDETYVYRDMATGRVVGREWAWGGGADSLRIMVGEDGAVAEKVYLRFDPWTFGPRAARAVEAWWPF